MVMGFAGNFAGARFHRLGFCHSVIIKLSFNTPPRFDVYRRLAVYLPIRSRKLKMVLP